MIKNHHPQFYWHIHHDALVEELMQPLANRIDYIMRNKPEKEIPTRLARLKKADLPEWIEHALSHEPWALLSPKVVNKIYDLHREQCPDCPWRRFTLHYTSVGFNQKIPQLVGDLFPNPNEPGITWYEV